MSGSAGRQAASGCSLQDQSAGTGSDGMAQAVYIAGPADSGKDGVLIQAHPYGEEPCNSPN